MVGSKKDMADNENQLAEILADEVSAEDTNLFYGLPSEYLHELTPAKNRMILLYITGQYSQNKLAQIIGVHPNTIRTWLMQPVVQSVISELQSREFEIIDSSLKSLRMKAVQTMDDLMSSPVDAVRLQASKDILDRTGHKPETKMKIDKTVVNLEQQLKDIAEFTIDDATVIDISDVIQQVKGEYDD